MKPCARLALPCLLLVCACRLLAQPPPGEPGVGIYTGDFVGPTSAHYEGTGLVTLFLIAFNLWCSDVHPLAGWQLDVAQEGAGAALVQSEIPGDGPLNTLTAPGFCVGYQNPSFPSAAIVIATLTYSVTSREPTYLYIRDTEICNSGWARGWPEAACADDAAEPFGLLPSSGSLDQPVFGFNTGPLGVGARVQTWGDIKGLYR